MGSVRLRPGRSPWNAAVEPEWAGSTGNEVVPVPGWPTSLFRMEHPTDHVLEQFVQRVETSPHNLVSKRARGELRARHLAECRSFAAMLPGGPARVLDVGSGGGFPGFVVAVMRPDLEVTLLEATRKKVDFLAATATELGVPCRTVHGRAEEVRRGDLAGSFDLVTARAVAPLDRLLGWTIPFLRPGGLLYAIKGQRWREELEAATEELRAWGAEVGAIPEEVGDPADPDAPHVVIIRRSPPRGASPTEDHR